MAFFNQTLHVRSYGIYIHDPTLKMMFGAKKNAGPPNLTCCPTQALLHSPTNKPTSATGFFSFRTQLWVSLQGCIVYLRTVRISTKLVAPVSLTPLLEACLPCYLSHTWAHIATVHSSHHQRWREHLSNAIPFKKCSPHVSRDTHATSAQTIDNSS